MDLKLTPTQRKMLEVLSDGLPHPVRDLHACIDFYGRHSNVQYHICLLRKQLPTDEAIICEFWRRQFCYRRIRVYQPQSQKV